MSLFVNNKDLVQLTGYTVKAKQIEALRSMGYPFRINALGRPVVTVAAIEGRREPVAVKNPWVSKVLRVV